MKDDAAAMDQSESRVQPTRNGGGAGSGGDENGTVRSELTPPPPSVPGEFLSAQRMADRKGPALLRSSPDALTPPPASAPSEFLDSQWSTANAAEEEAIDDARPFDDAFPKTITGTDDLDLLQEEWAEDEGSSRPEPAGLLATEPNHPLRIRGFPLLRDEKVSRVLLPNEGLSDSVPPSGQALILTNLRLIAFRGVEGYRDTHVARTADISQCSVRTGQRNWSAILQGLMIMVGGAFLYLVVGYWLAGQISGPNVPVLNIDVAPFIALLIILAGLLVLLQNYFTRPAGAVIFHGTGVEIAFPFRSSLDVTQVYDFVELAQNTEDAAGQPEGQSA